MSDGSSDVGSSDLLHLEVAGVDAAVGDEVVISTDAGPLVTQTVALRDEALVCMPYGETTGVRAGSPARATGSPPVINVGEALLGRVLDGLGRSLDGRPLQIGRAPL